jgi:hypothetical protein
MTQEQMIELARRAVACPKWWWVPGMRELVVTTKASEEAA